MRYKLMRYKLLSSLAATLCVGGAQVLWAADMPLKEPVIPAPAYNWAGWYVGGNIGYGWGNNTNPTIAFFDPGVPLGGGVGFAPFFAAGGEQYQSLTPSGVIGGGQVGYDWESPNAILGESRVVLGAVADFQGSGMKASGNTLVNLLGLSVDEPVSADIEWLGTVRGRLGLAQQNWFFYGTGGLAYGQVKSTVGFTIPDAAPGTFLMSGSQTTTRTGWAAGAGGEYQITSHWSVGLEYLHFDLGTDSVTAFPVVNTTGILIPGTTSLSANQKIEGDILRVTANYRF